MKNKKIDENLASEKNEIIDIDECSICGEECCETIFKIDNESYTWNDCEPNDELYSFLVKKGIF